MEDLYDKAITSENVESVLEKFEELGLKKHYNFSESVESRVLNAEDASELLRITAPLVFNFREGNVLYYSLGGSTEEVIFDEDVSNSFSRSDVWLYDKLVPVASVFPNASSAEVSSEMTGFYTCLVIAVVFGDVFKEEFMEVSSSYDFKVWTRTDSFNKNFLELSTSWVQLGSKYIKMVAAAAKYALVREKQKKVVPSALQLPEEMVLKLNRTINEVAQIRWNYENIKLAPEVRKKLSKLEIKLIIKEKDDAVTKCLTKDSTIYQIWRLMHLNSNMIPPHVLLRFNRESRIKTLELYKKFTGSEKVPTDTETKIMLKKIEEKFKREVRRAYLNRMLSTEVEKYVVNPNSYVAPSFV